MNRESVTGATGLIGSNGVACRALKDCLSTSPLGIVFAE
jgi:hypothetical protein